MSCIYAEVKPYQGDGHFEIESILPKLNKFRQHKDVVLLDGPPDFIWYYRSYRTPYDKLPFWWSDAMLYDQASMEDRWFMSCWDKREEMRNHPDRFADKYIAAVIASRQARFEHGEHGVNQ